METLRRKETEKFVIYENDSAIIQIDKFCIPQTIYIENYNAIKDILPEILKRENVDIDKDYVKIYRAY